MAPTITLYRLGARGKLHAAPPIVTSTLPGGGGVTWASGCSRLGTAGDRPRPIDVAADTVIPLGRACRTCGPQPLTVHRMLQAPLGTTPLRWWHVTWHGPPPWHVQLLAARMSGSALGEHAALLAAPRGSRKLFALAPTWGNPTNWSPMRWDIAPLPTDRVPPRDPVAARHLAATAIVLTADGQLDLHDALDAAARL